MKRLSLITIAISITAAIEASAQIFVAPDKLEPISGSSVYAICQDNTGAIWLNTNEGLFRYNGNSLENAHSSLPYHAFTVNEDKSLLYAAGHDCIFRFNSMRTHPSRIFVSNLSPEDCAFCAAGDSLIVGYKNCIYVSRGDSLYKVQETGYSAEISCLENIGSGLWAIGLEDGSILATNLESNPVLRASAGSRVLTVSTSQSGTMLWAGLHEGAVIYTSSFEEISRLDSPFLKDVRTICQVNGGTVYLGTPGGLFITGSDGKVKKVLIDGKDNYPVFSVIKDWNGDLWLGTLRYGCFYANLSSYPFRKEFTPESMQMITGLVRDRRGGLSAMTDAFGMYRKDLGEGWSLVEGTQSVKYQFAWYDPARDVIWTSDYRGDLMKIDPQSSSVTCVPVSKSSSENIWCVEPGADTLYVGTSKGLYCFSPEKEEKVSRRIPGIEANVRCLLFHDKGSLWIGTNHGTFVYSPSSGTVEQLFPDNRTLNSAYCSEIARGPDGSVAIALLGRGVVVIRQDGKIDYYNRQNGYLTDNHAKSVTFYGPEILVGCQSGLCIINEQNSLSYSYGGDNAIRASKGCFVPTRNSLLIGGQYGIYEHTVEPENIRASRLNLSFDHFYYNGRALDSDRRLQGLSDLVLGSEVKSFSVEFCTFNYPCVFNHSYEYRLDGLSQDWTGFDPSVPISFQNLRHGKYNLKVRERGGNFPAISLGVRIRPRWYATVLAKIVFFFSLLSLLLLIIHLYIRHQILARELQYEKKESREKIRFFVNLSEEIRTPVNLMIDQLEKYFKNFGAHSPGIEDIEDIYAKAGRIRGMIKDFVDSQSEVPSGEPSSEDNTKRAADTKFLNSATAVVESNMFTEDITTGFLCKELNIGRTTLSTRLRQICDMTPHEFIEDIRLRHAAQMIQDGNKRVNEIASDLRYSSPSYFAECFKKKYGCLPSKYRTG